MGKFIDQAKATIAEQAQLAAHAVTAPALAALRTEQDQSHAGTISELVDAAEGTDSILSGLIGGATFGGIADQVGAPLQEWSAFGAVAAVMRAAEQAVGWVVTRQDGLAQPVPAPSCP